MTMVGSPQYSAVVGPSDSGKTLIALELAGLVTGSETCGLGLGPIPAVEASYVPSDPYLAFSGIKPTLADEIQLSMQFLGRGGAAVQESVRRAAAALELMSLLDRDPFTLSGGEAMRAAIAVLTVKTPTRLVLDEIYGALAPDSVALVRTYVASLRERGCEIVEIFNADPEWAGEYDAIWRTDDVSKQSEEPTRKQGRRGRMGATGGPPALEVEGLVHRYGEGFQLGPIDLEIGKGEWLALIGPNGAGKTTLLKSLAGLLKGSFARLVVDGQLMRSPVPTRAQRKSWPQLVIYVFQNPDDQIYRANTKQELLETARWVSTDGGQARLAPVCEILRLDGDLDCAPMVLPRPRRKLVSVASALIAARPVLLLDEPSAGLDPRQRARLGEAIEGFCADGGSVIMISHDNNFVSQHAHRTVAMAEGRIVQGDL